MNDAMTLKLILVTVILAVSTAIPLSIAFLKFPENAIVIAISAAAMVGTTIFVQRKLRAALFQVYYSTVQEHGLPISFGGTSAAFERNGTRFDVDFPRDKNNTTLIISFFVPNLHEKFSIQNKTLATRYDSECKVIQTSPLPEDYLIQSRNEEFMLNLLKNREILNEIYYYPTSFWGRFLISFADGRFEIQWTPPVSEQIEGFRQICQTAVVFHDELKKLQKEK